MAMDTLCKPVCKEGEKEHAERNPWGCGGDAIRRYPPDGAQELRYTRVRGGRSIVKGKHIVNAETLWR